MEYWQQHPYPLWYFNFFSGCSTFLFWFNLSHSGSSSLTSGCKFQTAEIPELDFAFMSVSFVPLSTTELLLQSWGSPETCYTLTNFITCKVNNKVNMRKEHLKSATNSHQWTSFLKKKKVLEIFSIISFPFLGLLMKCCSHRLITVLALFHTAPKTYVGMTYIQQKCTKAESYFPFTFKMFLNLWSLHPL